MSSRLPPPPHPAELDDLRSLESSGRTKDEEELLSSDEQASTRSPPPLAGNTLRQDDNDKKTAARLGARLAQKERTVAAQKDTIASLEEQVSRLKELTQALRQRVKTTTTTTTTLSGSGIIPVTATSPASSGVASTVIRPSSGRSVVQERSTTLELLGGTHFGTSTSSSFRSPQSGQKTRIGTRTGRSLQSGTFAGTTTTLLEEKDVPAAWKPLPRKNIQRPRKKPPFQAPTRIEQMEGPASSETTNKANEEGLEPDPNKLSSKDQKVEQKSITTTASSSSLVASSTDPPTGSLLHAPFVFEHAKFFHTLVSAQLGRPENEDVLEALLGEALRDRFASRCAKMMLEIMSLFLVSKNLCATSASVEDPATTTKGATSTDGNGSGSERVVARSGTEDHKSARSTTEDHGGTLGQTEGPRLGRSRLQMSFLPQWLRMVCEVLGAKQAHERTHVRRLSCMHARRRGLTGGGLFQARQLLQKTFTVLGKQFGLIEQNEIACGRLGKVCCVCR
ncbi:unnamed protein product [Amoebophrya sp. A25]|nr:unnamed protein product [Amoebophrya sp. A25]|eukprot:GSA25T00009125001.1